MTSVQDYTELSKSIGLTAIAPSIDLANRTVVITGAAEGIGAALARAAHLYGAKVIGIDIQDDKLKHMETELGRERFAGIVRDLRQPMDDRFAAHVQRLAQVLGGIDGYVMNAGVVRLSKSADAIADAVQDLTAQFQINVTSHLAIYQVLRSYLKDSAMGRVVATSSPIVGRSEPSTMGYAITKQAMQALAAHLQSDLANSCALVNGYVPPPVQNWLRADLKNEPYAANALPEDVIEVALRLLSADLGMDQNGKMFVFKDQRSDVRKPDGTFDYQINQRTENGFQFDIRVRPLGSGGGTDGDLLVKNYDSGDSRRLTGNPPAPAVDPNVRLRDAFRPPVYIAEQRSGAQAG